ncbi:tetratricopeptide repeat protein [Sphingobium nicotianae]|uniref:Tetratricopeptide repeat protein n=1 Tax=Sphingobium nicotianae TaxID=2782607 RepID=A0A9X1DF65_9SPHN|nr:tetratricopeptide repeat protein [Sphingobium nicotianae]
MDDETSIRLASAFRAAGDYRSAIQVYRRLLSQKASSPDLRLELGETLIDAGLIDDAIGVFLAVSAEFPDNGQAQLGLARANLMLNSPPEALKYVEKAAALDQSNQRILIVRGVILDRLGRHSEAQASYRAALSLEPRSVAARNDLALSLALSGQYKEAIDILTPIARSADATAGDRQNLAFVLGLSGDVKGALALSRVDLDEAAAQANSRFFAFVGPKGR